MKHVMKILKVVVGLTGIFGFMLMAMLTYFVDIGADLQGENLRWWIWPMIGGTLYIVADWVRMALLERPLENYRAALEARAKFWQTSATDSNKRYAKLKKLTKRLKRENDEMMAAIHRLPKPPEDIGDGPDERVGYALQFMSLEDEALSVSVTIGFESTPDMLANSIIQDVERLKEIAEKRADKEMRDMKDMEATARATPPEERGPDGLEE